MGSSPTRQTRRVQVSRDLLKQNLHYLQQYHDMFIPWSVKTIELMPQGMERENFREGIARIFNEIQQCVARTQDALGETPQTKAEVFAAMKTPQYRKVVDKVQVQAYVHRIQKMAAFWRWPGIAAEFCLSHCISGILKAVAKLRRTQA